MRLHPKHQSFCEFYMVSGNATEAARAAGYAHDNAAGQGYRLLKRPEIQARLDEMTAEEDERFARQAAERQEHRARLAALRATEAEALLAKLDPVYEHRLESEDFTGVMKVVALQARIAGLLDIPTSPARAKRAPKAAGGVADDELEIG
jgi:phage terminase small subunit